MTIADKSEYHEYMQSPAFRVMSFQQWLAARAFMLGLLNAADALKIQRELKGETE